MIDEKTMLLANTLGGINAYIRDFIDDENAYSSWIEDFPDECDEDELMEIAENEKLATELIHIGASIIYHFTKEQA